MCFSAGSHTCATGPIRNPFAPEHSAGGSSGGSAALVAAGEVEWRMGGDQGGSIRTPSAWCGTYGLKPTWGLVPCTGAMPIAYALDHWGRSCTSPENVARLLTAIAGPDPLDPRTAFSATRRLHGRARARRRRPPGSGCEEGFAHPDSDPPPTARSGDAIEALGSAGAVDQEVSVPMHYDAPHVWTAIILEGATELMIKGNGQGNNWNGHYTASLIDVFARGWRSRPDDLSATCKLVLLLGEYLNRRYHGRYHAKGQNLKPVVKAAYDAALEQRRHPGDADDPVPGDQAARRKTARSRTISTSRSTCSTTPARSTSPAIRRSRSPAAWSTASRSA